MSSYAAEGASPFVLEGTRRVYERPRPFRVEHIALDLDLDHPARSLAGEAELHFERSDPGATELALDAVAFQIEEFLLRAGRARP